MTKLLKRAEIKANFINQNAVLPYGLRVNEVVAGIDDTYNLLFEINNFLVAKKLDRLEELLLGNSLSGLVSEMLVKNVSNNSSALIRNEKIGGHPDLIPRNLYHENQILRGEEGIEIKVSKQRGGWQGHNPEAVWLMVFRYILDERKNINPIDKDPITFVQVLAAKLTKEDWSFSGRNGNSRRTITASITESGMTKLRSNPIYQDPKYIVATNKKLAEQYRLICSA